MFKAVSSEMKPKLSLGPRCFPSFLPVMGKTCAWLLASEPGSASGPPRSPRRRTRAVLTYGSSSAAPSFTLRAAWTPTGGAAELVCRLEPGLQPVSAFLPSSACCRQQRGELRVSYKRILPPGSLWEGFGGARGGTGCPLSKEGWG